MEEILLNYPLELLQQIIKHPDEEIKEWWMYEIPLFKEACKHHSSLSI